MSITFSKLYPLYASQITLMLRDKSEMWSIGFRNGLLSNTSSKASVFEDLTLPYLAADYDVGFREGCSYAIYKMALHLPKDIPETH